ncbi:hypothetical protein BDV97DRAFT_366660 [Delphinella strobiligena]|nr:hypothetical protein BDV97DRAFT_366660 [Delphinella strobiligena]
MGRARTNKKRSAGASEEGITPATSSKGRSLPQVEGTMAPVLQTIDYTEDSQVRIYRAPSPVIRLTPSPIAPRCLGSDPTRSISPTSTVDASNPNSPSSESSQKSRHQYRYSTRSRMPALTRSTREIASDLIRTTLCQPSTFSIDRKSPTFTDWKLTTFQCQSLADSISTAFVRLAIPLHMKKDVVRAKQPTKRSNQSRGISLTLESCLRVCKHRLIEFLLLSKKILVTQCLEPVLDPCDPNPAPGLYPVDIYDHCSTPSTIQCDPPIGDGNTSMSDPDQQAHASQPPTTLDGIPSAIWFWGRLHGHARYPNFDEDRFRRICQEYVENTRHSLSDDRSHVKPERDSGDVHTIETRLDDDNISENSTIILEPSAKIVYPSQADSRHDVLPKSDYRTVPHASRLLCLVPSFGPSTQNLILQANVDLPFMRALCDENNFDNTLSHLDNVSLINVAKATTLIPFGHLQRKYWDIDQAFVDCLGPRGCPFALRFFSRLKTSKVAMDIFVPKERYRTLINHIRDVQNFKWKACESAWHISQSMRDAVRTITRFGKAETILSIFCTEDIPLRALLCCVANSSLLNTISHSNVYSLFPRETFINHRLRYFRDHHVPRQSDVGPAAASWGWQGTRLVEHDISTITLSSPELQETRGVGDRYTWAMSFAAPLIPTRQEEFFEARGELERHTFQLVPDSLSLCGLYQNDSSKEPHIKVEPAERPPTSVPIPPSRGFLKRYARPRCRSGSTSRRRMERGSAIRF